MIWHSIHHSYPPLMEIYIYILIVMDINVLIVVPIETITQLLIMSHTQKMPWLDDINFSLSNARGRSHQTGRWGYLEPAGDS